jgi:DNA-binding ferritin-like protein
MVLMSRMAVVSGSGQNPRPSIRLPATSASVFSELLTHSIYLRDCYKCARWQTADIQYRQLNGVFSGHYAEQLRLVDVLLERLRLLGEHSAVFAGKFLRDTQFAGALRGRIAIGRLLEELFEAHEDVLMAARPLGNGPVCEWMRELALGQVVLSNDLQRWTILQLQLTHSKGTL